MPPSPTAPASRRAGAAPPRAAQRRPAAARPGPDAIVADGNLPAPVLAALLDGARPRGRWRSCPRARARPRRLGRCSRAGPAARLYLNRAEAEALCGARFADSRAPPRRCARAARPQAIVTDGAAPATAATAVAVVTRAPPAVGARSVTGAGDVFVAAHLAARADGLGPEPAPRGGARGRAPATSPARPA